MKIRCLVIGLAVIATGCSQRMAVLPKSVYLDRMQGAWVGQMVGVSYGAPYEFRSMAQIDEGKFREWKPEYISNSILQDDLYMEMFWLQALEDYGLDLTPEQAGREWAATDFGLAHANQAGRANLKKGIMPPASGHPSNTPHANDIDYQIEADAIGIICPGLPRESNRLGWIFGHLMNYGDGVYGGLFMQGMYSAAYFYAPDMYPENRGQPHNVEQIIEAGLACIPAESLYARCIRDVLGWHRQYPNDWRATWKLVEMRYDDGRDCEPGKPFDIDAHINGAYVAMGLLYGGNDFWKVCEIATRCGQDSDCNPSSAAGVWGCMHGLSQIPKEAWDGLTAVSDRKFDHTRYNYRELIEATQRLTEKLITRAGGTITADAYRIPVQKPVPAPLEQWESPATAPAK